MSITNQSARRPLLIGLLILSLSLMLIIYYGVTIQEERSFGERYVDSEIPLIFPFYVIASFKPITIIVYLTFLGVVLILNAVKDKIKHRNMSRVRFALIFIAFATGYEVLWNFFAWFTSWEREGGVLDAVSNTTHQYATIPVNFNFATKVIFLVFAVSLYGSIVFWNVDRK